MIRSITLEELLRDFVPLVAEVECGDHFRAEDPEHVAWLKDRIAVYHARGAWFLANYREDGTPAGFLVVLPDKPLSGVPCFGQHAEILSFGVFRSLRRQGYGTELLDHAVELATSKGIHCLYASTYAGNRDAIAFYRRRGFTAVATLPDVNGPGDKGNVYLRKILRGAREQR